jgi:competence protein ComEC
VKRFITVLLLVGFILGVASGPIFYWQSSSVALWLASGLIILIVFYHRRHRYFALAVAFVVAVTLGNLRFGVSQVKNPNDVSGLAGQPVELTGLIANDPQPSGEKVKFTLKVLSVDDSLPVGGNILITTRSRPSYEYGNLVRLTGQLNASVNRGEFDYVGYLARFGIYSTMDYPVVELIEPFAGSPLLRGLYAVKHRLVTAIQRSLPEPAAALLSGLLFGIKSDFSDSLMNDFNRVGLTHIIALSGLNITIIAASLLWLFSLLPLRWRYGLAGTVIILFVLMTGASPSVIRAAIMGILVLLAGLTGRVADGGVALLLAAAIMLLGNPQILYHDVGFQLSFAATIGIIYLSPVFQDIFHRIPKWISGYLSPTLAALVFSTPLLIYQFERLSLIAPVSNLLVLPIIPLAMGLGFLAVVASLLYLPLGVLVGLLAVWPLNYIVGVTTNLSRLPAASLSLKISSAGWVFAAYAILGLGLIWGRYRAPKNSFELRPLIAPR